MKIMIEMASEVSVKAEKERDREADRQTDTNGRKLEEGKIVEK